MKLNKKANQMMGWSLIFVMFVLVITAYVHVWSKTIKFSSKTGEIQSEMIRSYDGGEKALIFVDQAAKYSIYESVYLLGEKGGYFNVPVCKYYPDDSAEYTLWKEIDNLCYPKKSDIRKSFNLFFNEQFNDYAEKYTSALIPTNNYDFNFDDGGNELEIIGIATQNILISKENLNYSLKPSFKAKTSYKFISKFDEYVNKTKEIENNIIDCLIRGSGKPDDDDLTTCSDIKMENYEIKPITLPKNYTLLFDIEDNSFKNPYSEEKLIIKLGIRFMDTFPPPLTEIIGIEERTEEGENNKYLTWNKNHASDIIKYKIYARTLKPTYIDENNLIGEINIENDQAKTEWKIEYNEDCSEKQKQGKTCLEKEQKYYFYIIAIDNADNLAIDMWPKDKEPEPITI